MTADRPAPAASPAHPRGRDPLGIQALRLFGLCGLAVAQPLLALLGGGPAFFVAHGATTADILLLVAVVLLLPPLLLLAAMGLVHTLAPEAGAPAMAALFGGLVALTVVAAVDRATPLPLTVWALLAIAVGVPAGAAYARFAPVRTFATYLGPTPLLFAGVFLFLSPVSELVRGTDPDAIPAGDTARTDVVVVVFDELPLGALLDADGDVDAARFPGFGRLAATSTWYPNATTVTPGTVFALPALLTGQYPREEMGRMWPPGEWDAPPIASRYPRSLFTMLGSTHGMNVFEWVTQLCPVAVCEASQVTVTGMPPEEDLSLAEDVWVVLAHQLLPTRVADERLPPLGARWAGFGAGAEEAARVAEDVDAARGEPEEDEPDIPPGDRFEAMLPTIRHAGTPQLWFAHERLPHRPVDVLPDGTRYPRHFPFDFYFNLRGEDGIPYRQQYLLQVQHVDRMLDRLLDRLEEEGIADDAIVVVTSDHGLSFRPEGHPRALEVADMTDGILSDVLPVPLFVRYPGQEGGAVDERDAQLVDVLPTIADVLGVTLPDGWAFDGRSLLADAPGARPLYWHPVGQLEPDEFVIDPLQLARENEALFGPGGERGDLYAMGPLADLVGEDVGGLEVGEDLPEAAVDPLDPQAYEGVDPGADWLPALYEATVTGLEPGTWVVVAVNGRVEGTGPVITGLEDDLRLKVTIDPAAFVEGENEVVVHLVDDGILRRVPERE